MKKLMVLTCALVLISLSAGNCLAQGKAQVPQIGLNIGNKAPALTYKTPEGKVLSLSSVNKGRYVLVDFWASWCGPCRMENPAVVMAFNEFKDAKLKGAKSGFTVFGVSLDQNETKWKEAIAKDGLSWTNHVSDLGGWGSEPARIYGVNSIPANFLLDPNGIIIAKGLRGSALVQELKKYQDK